MVSKKISILALLILLTYTSESWGAPSYDLNHQSNKQDCPCSGNSGPPKDVKAKPDVFIDLPTPEEDSRIPMDDEQKLDIAPYIEPQEDNHGFNFDIPSHYDINQMDVSQYIDNIPKSPVIPYDVSFAQKGTGQFNGQYPQVLSHAIPYNIQQETEQYNLPMFSQVIPHVVPSTQQGTGQFNEWILEQMEQFQGHDKIDLSSLGNCLIRILYENGMYVSDSGMLIDSYGTVLDIQSLSLRPILVGNTVPLGNLLQPDILSSQMHLPYSQAILVTASHPQKILGVMPLGKVYLPLSTMSTLDNTWKAIPKVMVSKPSIVHDLGMPYYGNEEIVRSVVNGKVNPENLSDEKHSDDLINKGKPPQTNKSIKSKKTSSMKNKNKEQERNVAYQPSNYINVNGNENVIGPRIARLGFEQNEDMAYSKKFNGFNFGLSLNDVPITKVLEGRSQEIPLDVIVRSQHYPTQFQLSDPNFDISLRKDNVLNGVLLSQSGLNSGEFRNAGVPIPGVVGMNSNPIKTLEKLSHIDMSLRSQTVPIPTVPAAQMSSNNVYDILGRHVPIRNIDTVLFDLSHSKPINQNIQGLIFPEQSDLMSRSAGDVTEIPENITDKDGNEVYDFLVGNDDDDDDDDGDFRIIGGNAATGSGTPLSNKGRSGFVS